MSHGTGSVIDVTAGFKGNVLGPIPVATAAARVLAYCTEPHSGWGAYDLAAVYARQAGLLHHVTTWSLLLANALNGQVSLENISDFSYEYRRDYAARIDHIPAATDLSAQNKQLVQDVAHACSFGYPGVWGPKITKLGALYRPAGIPILDSRVSMAFGFGEDGFSTSTIRHGLNYRERITEVVTAFGRTIDKDQDAIRELRYLVTPTIPELALIPDLRLLDIVIWTSQDDQLPRRERQGPRWDARAPGKHIPLAEFELVPLAAT